MDERPEGGDRLGFIEDQERAALREACGRRSDAGFDDLFDERARQRLRVEVTGHVAPADDFLELHRRPERIGDRLHGVRSTTPTLQSARRTHSVGRYQAAWPSGLGKGLQSPVHRFDSGRRL